MSNDRVFLEKSFNRPGFAKLLGYDERTHTWRLLGGAIKDIEFSIDSEKYKQGEVFGGRNFTTQVRTAGETAMLRFTMLETMGPEVLNFLLQEHTDAQTGGSQTSGVGYATIGHEPFGQPLYGLTEYPVPYRYGLMTAAKLGDIVTLDGVVSTAGGSGWTTGANSFYAVPIYASPNAGSGFTAPVPVAFGAAYTTWAANLDINYTAGYPSPVDNETFANADDKIVLTVTQIALEDDQPTPTGWAIFHAAGSGTALTACHFHSYILNTIARAGGTQAFVAALAPAPGSNSAYTAPSYFAAETLTGYQAGSPVYVKTAVGTDITYDSATGTFLRIAGGAIGSGQECRLHNWYIRPYAVTTPMGSSRTNSSTRKLKVISLEPEVDPITGEEILAEGIEFIFNKVDVAGLGLKMSFTEGQFDGGTPVECEVLHGAGRTFGSCVALSMKLRRWVQSYGYSTGS